MDNDRQVPAESLGSGASGETVDNVDPHKSCNEDKLESLKEQHRPKIRRNSIAKYLFPKRNETQSRIERKQENQENSHQRNLRSINVLGKSSSATPEKSK
jgi:hypothetical protein